MNAYRPTATSSNRAILTLKFIKDYWAEHGESPSLGEIAAAIDTDIGTASRIVGKLHARGDVVRSPGQRRGIFLPDVTEQISTSDAVAALRGRGWIVDRDVLHISAQSI